ncbi:MAG: S-layer protein domain-containing protein [Candidatus Micrarchaeota archaeon]
MNKIISSLTVLLALLIFASPLAYADAPLVTCNAAETPHSIIVGDTTYACSSYGMVYCDELSAVDGIAKCCNHIAPYSDCVFIEPMTPTAENKKTIVEGDTWNAGGDYSVTVQAIDANADPKQVWLVLNKGGVKLDDVVKSAGQEYYYVNKSNVTLFSTKVESIFAGMTNNLVQLRNTSILSSELEPKLVSVYGYSKKTIMEGETWNISNGGGYKLSVMSIDVKSTPRQAWLTLTKDGVVKKESIVQVGKYFNYTNYTSGQIIFSTYVDSAFAGATSNMLQVKNTSILSTELWYYTPMDCVENWSCSDWGECIGEINVKYRTCADVNYCGGNGIEMPNTWKNCNEVCVENWTCGEWSACADNEQSRICADANVCGTNENQPIGVQSCSALGCIERWTCGAWSACADGEQNRICTEINNCGTIGIKPAEAQKCTETPTACAEKWSCGAWSACVNGGQTRICTDENNCGTDESKPTMKQNCGTSRGGEIVQNQTQNNTAAGSNETSGIKAVSVDEIAESMGAKVNSIQIAEENGKPIYIVMMTKKVKFFSVFMVSKKVEVRVSAETGEVISD